MADGNGLSPKSCSKHQHIYMPEERAKQKSKVKLSQVKYENKGRKPAAKFQKKLVLIDYMGPDAPRRLTVALPSPAMK